MRRVQALNKAISDMVQANFYVFSKYLPKSDALLDWCVFYTEASKL